jgi:hypothetical protein
VAHLAPDARGELAVDVDVRAARGAHGRRPLPTHF